MKQLFYASALCLCCIACTRTQSSVSVQEGDSGQSEVKTEVVETKPSLDAENPELYVAEVYRLVADKYSVFPPKKDDIESKVMSSGWEKAVALVVARDTEVRKYDEDYIGFFDSDYWVMGQDYETPGFKVDGFKTLSNDGTTAKVSGTIHSYGEKEVHVQLVKENGKWRVDNLIDVKDGVDWRKGMAEYTHEDTTNPKGE